MTVNTIAELNNLLVQVDADATVLSAIANDAATSVASGPSAGLVTTRLGSNVKNVQKVIADIENGIVTGVKTAVQEEGSEILPGPTALNFIGTGITVTDVGGVATITVTPDVTKVGTPVNNQIGVWTGDGTLDGDTKLTWDGSILTIDGTLSIDKNINTQTGVLYILAATDKNSVILANNAAANVIQIPPNVDVAFAIGTCIKVIQIGAGVTSLTAGAGVTLNGIVTGSGALAAAGDFVDFYKTSADTWWAVGDIGVIA